MNAEKLIEAVVKGANPKQLLEAEEVDPNPMLSRDTAEELLYDHLDRDEADIDALAKKLTSKSYTADEFLSFLKRHGVKSHEIDLVMKDFEYYAGKGR